MPLKPGQSTEQWFQEPRVSPQITINQTPTSLTSRFPDGDWDWLTVWSMENGGLSQAPTSWQRDRQGHTQWMLEMARAVYDAQGGG